MKTKPNLYIGIRFSLSSFLLFSSFASADVIYAGYSQNEVSSVVGTTDIDLEPGGLTVIASFNLNDNWSIGVDLGKQDDSSSIANTVVADYDSDNWGVNLTYYNQSWAFTYNFSNWEDDLDVTARFTGGFPGGFPDSIPVETQNNDSPSHSLRATRYFTGANWQVGLSGGIHYNDWKQETESLVLGGNGTIIATTESGESTFLSVGVDGAWFFSVSDARNLIAGASVNWNEHLSDEVDGIAISGRNFNQFGSRNIINNLNNLTVSGSQSYGQASLYASLDITEQWIIDISTGFDFALDDNGQYWSVNLGYLF